MSVLAAPAVAPSVASRPGASAPAAVPDPKTLEVARQFEAIFLRKMLASLEKTTRLSSRNRVAGNGVYSSMVVGAVADAVSASGGIGLADRIARALLENRTKPG